MIKSVYTLVLILYSFFSIQNCRAQWGPDVRLTNDPAISANCCNNAWCVASSGSVVHIVWTDQRDLTKQIYYKRSSDAGITWGADTRMTNGINRSENSSIAVSGSVVHVFWRDDRDAFNLHWEIYYKRSTDAGISWGAETRLTNKYASSDVPSAVVSGSFVNIVWTDNRDGNNEIYYKRSTDAGISWGTDTRLTNNNFSSSLPSVAVSGSVVHVVWEDQRDGNYEIYYKRSTDAGLSWGADTNQSNNSAGSHHPCVVISGSVVHVVWCDEIFAGYEILYKRSTNAGLSWGANIRLTNNVYSSWSPSIALSGSFLHVVWEDDLNKVLSKVYNKEIFYKHSTDAGLSWGADTRLTNNSYDSWSPCIALSGSVVHVVWPDTRDGNYEIYYKRNPTGNLIGIQNISTEIPASYSLGQNYPNPFNPITNVKFSIVNSGDVKLVVYDVMGREVQTLVNEKLHPGTYETTFDGSMLNSGVYFYKLITDGYTETKKMLMIK